MLTNDIRRPILWYFGGKWRLAPKIVRHFPQHKIYVEPFGGGASVLIRKPKSKVEVYNDTYDDIVNFFYVLRDRSGELLDRIMLTPYARAEKLYCSGVDLGSVDDIERARIFFVRSWQDMQHVGMVGWTGWRRARTMGVKVPEYDDMLAVALRFRKVYIESLPAPDIIQFYDSKDTLFYIDPPYVGTGKHYSCAMSRGDHISLARLLCGIKGLCIVSGLHGMYDVLYKGWRMVEYDGLSMQSNSYKECLWMNWDELTE